MPLFKSGKSGKSGKENTNIRKKDVLGEWIHRNYSENSDGGDDLWIFFVFYKDNICEYLDNDDDARSWNYSVSGGSLKLWGADESKAMTLEIRLNGDNLVINSIEYTRNIHG